MNVNKRTSDLESCDKTHYPEDTIESENKRTEDETPIESGIIKNQLSKFIDDIAKSFGKAFGEVFDELDKNIKDTKQNSKGEMLCTVFPDDPDLKPYRMKIDQIKMSDDGTGEAWMSFQDPSGQIYDNVFKIALSIPNDKDQQNNENQSDTNKSSKSKSEHILFGDVDIVNYDDMADMIGEFERRIMTSFPVAASTKISLQKIVGTDEISVNLLGIESDDIPSNALANLNTVLDDPDFIGSMIADEPVGYLISDNGGDSLSVEPLDDVDSIICDDCSILMLILSELKGMQDNLCYIRDNIPEYTDYRTVFDTCEWKVLDDITSVNNYLKMIGQNAPNRGDLVPKQPYLQLITDPIIQAKECIQYLIDIIHLYQDCITNEEIHIGISNILLHWEEYIVSI